MGRKNIEKAEINHSRTFGVEIEFLAPRRESTESSNAKRIARELSENGIETTWEKYTHEVMHRWKIVTDGSVYEPGYDGFELVSPILTWERVGEVEDALLVLKNELKCGVNTRCGFHVHHDVNDYRPGDFVRVLELYSSGESTLDRCVHPTRRKNANTFCKSLRNINIPNIRKTVMGMAEEYSDYTNSEAVSAVLNQIKYDYNTEKPRFMKLNLESYRPYGTIEFRHFHGTLDPIAARSWILLTQRIVETARIQTRFNLRQKDWLDLTFLIRFMRRGSIPEFAAARRYFDRIRELEDERRRNGLEIWSLFQPYI